MEKKSILVFSTFVTVKKEKVMNQKINKLSIPQKRQEQKE